MVHRVTPVSVGALCDTDGAPCDTGVCRCTVWHWCLLVGAADTAGAGEFAAQMSWPGHVRTSSLWEDAGNWQTESQHFICPHSWHCCCFGTVLLTFCISPFQGSQLSWNSWNFTVVLKWNCPEILLIWSECPDVDLCYAVATLFLQVMTTFMLLTLSVK